MINTKNENEIQAMQEGGRKLSRVKEELKASIAPGVTPRQVDKKAEKLILQAGGKPSFKMVPGYSWTTCINVNEGVVHGIPKGEAFREGDLVSVDVGMFYKGFHTDTSFTVAAGKADRKNRRFLEAGRRALRKAIDKAVPGNRVAHISQAMQRVLENEGFTPVRALTGHGIGKDLHEEPQIPCFWEGKPENSDIIPEGATLAIEAIYTLGSPELVISRDDNWTISSKDGKIAGLFEETVLVSAEGPLVLTA